MADCICKQWSWGTAFPTPTGHHPYCDGTGKNIHESYLSSFVEWDGMEGEMTKSEPGLSLLVIDLGDCCVVRRERGKWPEAILAKHTGFEPRNVEVIESTFAELQALLDANWHKPVPRIEREDAHYRLHRRTTDGQAKELLMLDTDYEALGYLAGHDLPIYSPKAGKWEPLTVLDWTDAAIEAAKAGYGIDKHSFERAIVPFKAWRYSR